LTGNRKAGYYSREGRFHMPRNSTLLFMVVVCLTATLSLGQEGKSGQEQSTHFYREHATFGFSFELPGSFLDEEEWKDVKSPRKFTYQVTAESGNTRVYVHVFNLHDKEGDWWLSEVMGFLFEPEVSITTDLTKNGYELILLDFPGGHGVHPDTQALVVVEGCAFRFICPRCHELGGMEGLTLMYDSLDVVEDLRTGP